MATQTRVEYERLAKRAGRLAQTVSKLEAKGRASDPSFREKLAEIETLYPQIIKAHDEAKADLHQAKTDAIFARRKMAKERAKLKKDREAFEQECAKARAARKKEQATARHLAEEVAKERASLAEATEAAKSR